MMKSENGRIHVYEVLLRNMCLNKNFIAVKDIVINPPFVTFWGSPLCNCGMLEAPEQGEACINITYGSMALLILFTDSNAVQLLAFPNVKVISKIFNRFRQPCTCRYLWRGLPQLLWKVARTMRCVQRKNILDLSWGMGEWAHVFFVVVKW